MGSHDVSRIAPNYFPLAKGADSKTIICKKLGFAVAIIFGFGSLIVASIGVCGLLKVGALSHLGQVNSMIVMVIGGGGSIPLMIIGIVGFFRTCSNGQSVTHKATSTIQMADTFKIGGEQKEPEQKSEIKAQEEAAKQQAELAEEQKRIQEQRREAEEQEASNRAELERKAREDEILTRQRAEAEAKAYELELIQKREQRAKAKAERQRKAKEQEEAQRRKEQERKAEEERKKHELEMFRLKTEEEAKRKAEAEQKQREEERKNHPLETFKKEICFVNTNSKAIPIIAGNLSKIIHSNLSLQDAVNVIFEKCFISDIPLLLDALLLIDTSLTLSPYDKIRRKIVEDEQHVLTNSTFMAMLNEYGINAQGEIAACYDLAYRMNHPYIYCLASDTVSADAYTLNFLWVNLNPQDRMNDLAQNIFKDGLDLSENADCIKDPEQLRKFEATERSLEKDESENWEKIKKTFTYRISKWADINPQAQINLWYDSALVTQKAQQKTFEMMQEISQSRGVNLRLRDLRQLPSVTGEIEHCFHPGTHVYARVDFFKALIGDYMVNSPNETAQYCVVSDIDIEPMSSEQLFDQRTLGYLNSVGYVFNRVGLSNFENSFFIFNKENKDFSKIHNETLIQKAVNTITQLRKYPIDTVFKDEYILDAQFIFRLYSSFRQEIGETRGKAPRKVVSCPRSQFNFSKFSKSDYRSETFRFIGTSNIPYTKNGRNYPKDNEAPIDFLINWKAEPLASP